MFGSDAALDLSGSFHVSTADYLRMGDNERFYARPQANDVLSVAAPAAFGFLEDAPASVAVEGNGELSTEIWGEDYDNWWDETDTDSLFPGLVVPEGETTSVIGGDINIKGTFFADEEYKTKTPLGTNLSAPWGQISLASVGGAGEVNVTESGLDISAELLGDITISDGAKITVNSASDDDLYIS